MRAKRNLRLENLEERKVFTTLPGVENWQIHEETWLVEEHVTVDSQAQRLAGDWSDGNVKEPAPEVRSRVSELVLAASAFMADEQATDQVMAEIGEQLTDDGGFITPFDAVSVFAEVIDGSQRDRIISMEGES